MSNPITREEHRVILDKFLSGRYIKIIAKQHERSVQSIFSLVNKTFRNYDEGGTRLSPEQRLLGLKSSLISNRIKLNSREQRALETMWENKLDDNYIRLVMNLDHSSYSDIVTIYKVAPEILKQETFRLETK